MVHFGARGNSVDGEVEKFAGLDDFVKAVDVAEYLFEPDDDDRNVMALGAKDVVKVSHGDSIFFRKQLKAHISVSSKMVISSSLFPWVQGWMIPFISR